MFSRFTSCRERDSNPHSHHWPRDFKSLVSTNSTIAAFATAKLSLYFDITKYLCVFFMFLTNFVV